MNLIGKIFVVLIFVMSVVFASFAIAVYGTHENWKTKAADLQKNIELVRADLQKAQEEQARLVKQIDDETLAKRQALAKLETEKTELQTQRDELVKQRDALMTKDKEAVAALDVAQQNLAKLTKEVDVLRVEIRDAQSQRTHRSCDAEGQTASHRCERAHGGGDRC